MDFRMYFMLFIVYSLIGWIVEVVGILIQEKKLVNRGFLIGPYCPIYGVGGITIILLLNKYMEDPIILFVMAIVICSLLEYFTSYIMEKLFKTRWWDYSNFKFNINGRICLETMWAFGALACFVIYVINPPLINLLKSLPNIVFSIISYSIMVLFLVDNIISFKIISNVKVTAKNVKKDNTEEMTRYVRDALSKKSLLNKRLINAFPNLQACIKNIKNGLKRGLNNNGKKK
ncbi:MAG: putative ABC transporter permease [Bacilli bacterium]|nr:putative ABC transporter permease [Bacilli bacterium]